MKSNQNQITSTYNSIGINTFVTFLNSAIIMVIMHLQYIYNSI